MGRNEKGISRRDLFKLGGLTAAGIAGAGALAGCSTGATTTTGETAGALAPSFFNAPAAITSVNETKEYDIVVIGAGAAGVPCALSAAESGAKVALLQKMSVAVSQGNSGTGIVLETSDATAVESLIGKIITGNNHRAHRKLIENWAWNSGEAVKWVIDRATAEGATVADDANRQQVAILTVDGYGPMNYVTSFFGPKPYNAGDGMQALAKAAEKAGVEIFYETPAQQLVKEGDKVIGVIAKTKDDQYIQFNGSKGIVLATGDYQNDEEMSNYYIPDLKNFERKQAQKTGDGHKMGLWAGGAMEPLNHTKMLHDFDAGPASMCDMPFMAVDETGNRFVKETVPMSVLNNYLRQEERTGWYTQVFDSKYMTFAATWPGKLIDPEGLKNYMPNVETEKVGVWEPYIGTYTADTLEDLAAQLEIDPAALKASVERYNELVALGKDEDFGVPAKYLNTIDTPPFYGIHRHIRLSAICSGLSVDENNQVLDENDAPLDNLYAIGNCAGYFYGGVDYPLEVFGLSLGRCYTAGYTLGRDLASK